MRAMKLLLPFIKLTHFSNVDFKFQKVRLFLLESTAYLPNTLCWLSFLQDMHPPHPEQCCSSNNPRAGVDPDQELCTEELPAEQAREYSLGNAGYTAADTSSGAVLPTDHLHISYHPSLDLTRNILVGEGVLFFFLNYLCSFTGYQLTVRLHCLGNHNKAGKLVNSQNI